MNNILSRLLKKMRSRTQPDLLASPCLPYVTELEYAVHLMSQRLGCGDREAIAAVNRVLEDRLDLSQIIHCLRHGQDIPVSDESLSVRLNSRFYQQGAFVGFRGFVEAPARPISCEGCVNYCGMTYGGNTLVCAIYPYGVDSPVCDSWEGEEGA